MNIDTMRIYFEGDGAGDGDAGVGDAEEEDGIYGGFDGMMGFEGGAIGGAIGGAAAGLGGAAAGVGGGEAGEPGAKGLAPGGAAETKPKEEVKLPSEEATEKVMEEVEPKKRKKRRPTILTADEDVLGVGTYGKRKRLLGE